MLASLIFVVAYFVILSVTKTNNLPTGLSSNNFYTLPPPLNGLQKEKYTTNTELIQKQLFVDILQSKCS